MSRSRDPNSRVLAALVVSLLVHAGIIPVLVVMMSAPRETVAMGGRFHPEDFLEEAEEEEQEQAEEPPEPKLGLETPPRSTLTWIGYEDYEEHLAELAEVEQAAFQRTAVASATPTEEPVTEPPTEPSQPETPEIESPETETAEAEVVEAEPVETPAPPEAGPEAEAAPNEAAPKESPPVNVEELLTLLAARDGAAPTTANAKAEDAPEPPTSEVKTPPDPEAKPAPAPKPEPKPEPKPAAPEPTPEPKPTPPKPPAPAPPAPAADTADKESDATSIVEVPFKQLGQPLARQGLEIRPERPRFTPLMLASTSPANPLVEIKFGPDGKPAEAGIVTSSGYRDIDHAIKASLFRWRAKGAGLEDLADGETIDIRIRILLGRRRR